MKLLPLSKQVVVPESELFKVEVDPMQSVFIDEDRIFMFRRIVIQNRIYRQGAVIAIRSLLNHLAESYFVGQPMAKFTSLQFKIISKLTKYYQRMIFFRFTKVIIEKQSR